MQLKNKLFVSEKSQEDVEEHTLKEPLRQLSNFHLNFNQFHQLNHFHLSHKLNHSHLSHQLNHFLGSFLMEWMVLELLLLHQIQHQLKFKFVLKKSVEENLSENVEQDSKIKIVEWNSEILVMQVKPNGEPA